MEKLKNFINGEYISYSKKNLDVISPYTEEKIAEITDSNIEDVNAAVRSARKSFELWKNTTPQERSNLFLRLAQLLEENKEKIINLESKNQGKPITLAGLDIDFAIDNLKFFAGAARCMQTTVSGNYIDKHFRKQHKAIGTSILKREPLGVVASIIHAASPIPLHVQSTRSDCAARRGRGSGRRVRRHSQCRRSG